MRFTFIKKNSNISPNVRVPAHELRDQPFGYRISIDSLDLNDIISFYFSFTCPTSGDITMQNPNSANLYLKNI